MLTAIGDVMREMYNRGWITTRDGNISLRRQNKKTMYITPSGYRKTIIHPEHVVRMKFRDDGTLKISDGAEPSGELHMHRLILKDAKETRAVVHAHPTYTVAAMYRGYDLQLLCDQFPEIFRYTKVGPTVPFLPAVSDILGDVTAKKLGVQGKVILYDIVGQEQHGVTSVAGDPWAAFEHIERLEHICQIVLNSGVTPEEVNDRRVEELSQ